MNENENLCKQLETLNQNIVELTQVIKQLIQLEESKKQKKVKKPQSSPLTESDVLELKAKFDQYFEKWQTGNEHEVRNQLETMPVDELKRFADANNLTVNSKQSKEKVLRAIVTRFREKKMLLTQV
jgi:hypothetical protein